MHSTRNSVYRLPKSLFSCISQSGFLITLFNFSCLDASAGAGVAVVCRCVVVVVVVFVVVVGVVVVLTSTRTMYCK